MRNTTKGMILAILTATTLLLAGRQPQDADLAKRMERIEQRLDDYQKRLEKLETLAGAGRVKAAGTEAKIAITRAMMRNLGTALDMFKMDNGQYPTTEQGLRALFEKPKAAPVPKNWNQYIDSEKGLLDPWGVAFVYRFPGEKDRHSYDFSSAGPDGKAGTEDDILDK